MKPRLLLITLTSPSTPLLKYVKANCSVKPSIRMKPNPMHRGLVPEKGESDLLPNELKVAWSRKAAMKGDVRSWFTKTNLHGLLFYFKHPSAIQRGFGRHNGKKKTLRCKGSEKQHWLPTQLTSVSASRPYHSVPPMANSKSKKAWKWLVAKWWSFSEKHGVW